MACISLCKKKTPPIVDMSTNGQLLFTDVDKITFEGVGNASNAVIDTTTGKIGIGVDNPDANLQVEGNCFVSTDMVLGGTLIMGTVNVEAQHALSAITATGNTTPHTVEFQNADTSLVTTGNVQVGKELTVTGNTTLSSNLTVSGNTTVSSNLIVSGFVGTSETGALNIPSGTTAQQPTGVSGMIRFNTTRNKLEYHNGTDWTGIGEFSASGGDHINEVGVYKIHIFENSGTFQTYSSGNVDILIVGGGGAGGGGRHGGGGGAGAVIHATNVFLSSGEHIITIGAGGSGAAGNTAPGNATNTTILKDGTTLYSALRGGHGGVHPSPGSTGSYLETGQDGGCGGGAGHSTTQTNPGYARLGLGLSATPAFGGNGGAGLNRAATGGGGGAGANGATGTGGESAQSGTGGSGGNGYQLDITGTSLYWAGGGGGSASPNTYRNSTVAAWIGGDGGNGGGGGGATGVRSDASSSRAGNGGAGYNSGSAGAFTIVANTCHGGNGGINTGGGGGGAGGWSNDGNGNGGNGGKGIVVIRYLK